MLLFEVVSTLIVLGVMLVGVWTTVRMMASLTDNGVKFIFASWLTTTWAIVFNLASSTFLLAIVRILFGV